MDKNMLRKDLNFFISLFSLERVVTKDKDDDIEDIEEEKSSLEGTPKVSTLNANSQINPQ